MRISDWSSDVCSSDLIGRQHDVAARGRDNGDGLELVQQGLQVVGAPCAHLQLGRASGRERVWQDVSISGVAGTVKKKNTNNCIEAFYIHRTSIYIATPHLISQQ